MLGMHGNYGPNVLTNECDVLIALGMRFDDRYWQFSYLCKTS
jgi:acetolactate synthase-1/2/3 large subunit